MHTQRIGIHDHFHLVQPIDHLYRGTIARVFQGFIGEENRPFAVKILRPEKIKDVETVETETKILMMLHDRPYTTQLVETGFIKLDPGCALPADFLRLPHEPLSPPDLYWATGLRGVVERFPFDETVMFLKKLRRVEMPTWLPYLVIKKRRFEGRTPDEPFLFQVFPFNQPVAQQAQAALAVEIAKKICPILTDVHEQGILYNDFKLAHFLWLGGERRVVTIDWNLSKLYPAPLSPALRTEDLVFFCGRVLAGMLTGDDSIQRTGGPIPWGKIPPSAQVPGALIDLVEAAVNGRKYDSAAQLEKDLNAIHF